MHQIRLPPTPRCTMTHAIPGPHASGSQPDPRNHPRISYIAGLVLLIGGSLTPASELSDWYEMERKDTCADYETFLANYPSSKLATLAQKHLETFCRNTGTESGESHAVIPSPATDPRPLPSAPKAAVKHAADVPAAYVQQALKDLGYYQGPVNGVMGPAINKANRSFQRKRGYAATGMLTARQIADLIDQAAQDGHPESQRNLGNMAAQGLGIPQDLKAAERWLRLASAQGNAKAAVDLAALQRKRVNAGVVARPDGEPASASENLR